jgi:hypothetical protein
MQFKLKQFHRDIPTGELLEDLKQAAKKLTAQGGAISSRAYATAGRFSAGTFAVRFGSWNKALIAAGLEPSMVKNVSTDALFENLRVVWVKKGDQPVFRDMSSPPSRFSSAAYVGRFGSWRKALQEFVTVVQSDDWIANERVTATESEQQNKSPDTKKKKTGRNISERMRFRILLRDGFACQACGASPLQDRGVELHVDHILPWSKGGETEEINLQTKCTRCNLGKGNAFAQ